MKKKRHCDLCDHQKLNLEKGSLCGVTNKKANFNRTCIKIDLNDRLIDQLEDIIMEYEDLKQSKKKLYTNDYARLFLGIFFVFCGYFFWRHFLNKGYVSLVSIKYFIISLAIILSTGFAIIKNAINKLNKYKNQLITSENNKINVDEVLRLYNKKYKYKINFEKEVHGIQEIDIDVKIL